MAVVGDMTLTVSRLALRMLASGGAHRARQIADEDVRERPTFEGLAKLGDRISEALAMDPPDWDAVVEIRTVDHGLAAERDRLRATLVKVRAMVANSAPPAIERLDVGACLREIDEALR